MLGPASVSPKEPPFLFPSIFLGLEDPSPSAPPSLLPLRLFLVDAGSRPHSRRPSTGWPPWPQSGRTRRLRRAGASPPAGTATEHAQTTPSAHAPKRSASGSAGRCGFGTGFGIVRRLGRAQLPVPPGELGSESVARFGVRFTLRRLVGCWGNWLSGFFLTFM